MIAPSPSVSCLAVMLASAVVTTQARAAFVLVDNFNSYATSTSLNNQGNWRTYGDTTNAATTAELDPAGGSNKVLRHYITTSGTGAFAYNNNNISIANGSSGTLFFRFRYGDAVNELNVSVGLSTIAPASGSANFANFGVQARMLGSDGTAGHGSANPLQIDARDAGAFAALHVSTAAGPTPTPVKDVWYNMWIVAYNDGSDGGNDYSRLYLQSDQDSNFATQKELVLSSGLINFRNNASSTLQSFILGAGGSNNIRYYVDDIYVDNAGSDLANPVPEPAGAILLASAGMLGLIRRRKRLQ